MRKVIFFNEKYHKHMNVLQTIFENN